MRMDNCTITINLFFYNASRGILIIVSVPFSSQPFQNHIVFPLLAVQYNQFMHKMVYENCRIQKISTQTHPTSSFVHYFYYRVHNHISQSLGSTANDIGLPGGVGVYNVDRVILQKIDSWQKCPFWRRQRFVLSGHSQGNPYENNTFILLSFVGLEPAHFQMNIDLFYFLITSIKQVLHHKSYFSISSNGAKHFTQ